MDGRRQSVHTVRAFETYPNLLLKGVRALRTDGPFRTAKYVLQFIHRETVARAAGCRFDRTWKVDTSGVVYPPQEDVTAEKYEATPPRAFNRIMRSIGCLTAHFVFFDMGCGKGRVLLMASQYGFRRIVGVECVPGLAKIAEQNVRRFRSTQSRGPEIEVVCADAAGFEFPDEDAVIFFFHPFKELPMARVLDNIRSSAKSAKVRYIVYYNPVLARLLSDRTRFSLIVNAKKYHIYRIIPHA
jgi:SAM-dependent methyltransferase